MRQAAAMQEHEDRGQVSRLGRALQGWLDDPEARLDQLVRWLQGHDVPSQQEEAYVWLLRALPRGSTRRRYEQELAEWVAKLLRLQPDQRPIGRRPDQLLYNLLMLAVGLRSGECLAEPLWEMYQRRSLSGEWLGASLQAALCSALVHNQVDQRLGTVWKRMSKGQPDEFLGGNEFTGLEGEMRMPNPGAGFGKPSQERLGPALGALAHRLDRQPALRRESFCRQISRLQSYYTSHEMLSKDLIEMADDHNWPAWSIGCLPSLYLPVRPTEEGSGEYYLWKPYTKILCWLGQDLDVTIGREMCRGEVAIVRLGTDAVHHFEPISQRTEERRRRHPHPSDRSLLGAITDALAEHVRSSLSSWRSKEAHARAVKEWISSPPDALPPTAIELTNRSSGEL